ncbi:MAG: response regulator [Planctomycetota bacterium]|jgi:CheY-like chemotaxis protein
MDNPCVLIVDDDPDFVEVTRAVLEGKNYRVRSASNGDEALACLEEESPDAILLDVMMRNRGEGFIIARRLKTDKRFAGIPILMLTAMRDATGFYFPGEAKHPKFLPVDEYLEKPIEADVLLEKVERQIAARFAD